MAWVVVVILLIAVIVFGISSGMDSYADARQAQATIEVAQVAQTQAWANMISLLVMAVVILLILFALVALIIIAIRFMQVRAESRPVRLDQPRRAALLADRPQLRAGPIEPTVLDDLTSEEIELVRHLLDDLLSKS